VIIEVEEAEPRSRARWLGVVLIVVALAALVWQAWVSGMGDELSLASPPESTGKTSLQDMLASVEGAKLGAWAASSATHPAMPASAPLAPGETEVCGVGRVKADDTGQPKDMAPIRLAAQRARERLLSALANSPDEVARAAGLLLLSAGRPQFADESCDTADCAQRTVPANNPGGRLRSDLVARDALASMALTTRSPKVYALAMNACQSHRKEGVCLHLSPEQWARLDPDNAVPWLYVAADAGDRREAPTAAEAFFRVSRAARSDAHWGAVTGLVLAKLPPELPILDKVALAGEVLSLEAEALMPFVPASQYCSVADVRDANRQQVCSAMAEVLVNKGSSLMDVALGTSIGQRAGWPAERLAALQEERDALLQLNDQSAPAQRWSCNGLARTLNQLTEMGQHGELGAMRRALKQSPEPVAVLARKQRESSALRAASAASGAASKP
jgi:hypothetical protein